MSNNKAKQLELLKKEINWWEENLKTKPKDTSIYINLLSPVYSTLCKNYNLEEMPEFDCCVNCPVCNYTSLQYCNGTTYTLINDQMDVLLSITDEYDNTDDKHKHKLLLIELTIEEDKLYGLSCDYWRFLKYRVLPFVVNKQEK